MALDRLLEKIAALQNPTVAGLDPKLDYVPESVKKGRFHNTGKRWKARQPHCWSLTKGSLMRSARLYRR